MKGHVKGLLEPLEATYFHEIRGQSPFTLNTLKVRGRQSEERIVDLASMTTRILQQWQALNKALPKNIIYYRALDSYILLPVKRFKGIGVLVH